MAVGEASEDRTQSFVPLTTGGMVSHFKIIKQIGSGGMGEVYLAEDTVLGRKVALKFLPLQYIHDTVVRARFTREARAVAALSHPNIVTIHEVGEFNDRPFFAMEYVSGETLREVIKRGKLDTDEAIDLAMQICEGLQAAHDAGVVHRDVKPGNIIIDTKGRARVLDFGLAMVAGEERLTQTGTTLGTVGYMSPEQVKGARVDHRSDLFSVGVILYEMLAGRRPFEGDNDAAIVRAITDSTPEPVARFKSGVTGELQQIIDRALAKDVSIRYQHADGILADLKRLRVVAAPKRRRRVRWAVGIAAVAVIAIGGYLSYAHFFGHPKVLSREPKRLVVLPFDNLGGEDQAYFASGMTDEVISRLSNISGLSVVSRMSAAKMKEAGEDLKNIGKDLNAQYVLEASARYAVGSDGTRRVRLVTQLINVTQDRVVWSQTYDTVINEVFAVQSEIAQQVADEMGVVLLPKEKKQVWEYWTTNEQAYDYYLRGSAETWRYGGYGRKALRLGLELAQKAVALDSTFALAYNHMSQIYSRLYHFGMDRSDSTLRFAKLYADKARQFSENAWVRNYALAEYYYRCLKDYPRALEYYDSAHIYVDKNNYADYLNCTHHVLRRMGKWEEAYDRMKRVIELDPKLEVHKYDLATDCEYLRRYPEAESLYKEIIALKPDFSDAYANLAWLYIRWQGDTKKARDVIQMSTGKIDSTELNWYNVSLDIFDGNYETALHRITAPAFSGHEAMQWRCQIYAYLHEDSLMRVNMMAAIDTAITNAGTSPEFDTLAATYHTSLAYFYAYLGRKEDALREIERSLELLPLAKDAMDGTWPLIARLQVYTVIGELDQAMKFLDELLSIPADFYFGQLLVDLDFRPLVRHPGFERILNKYGDEIVKQKYSAFRAGQKL